MFTNLAIAILAFLYSNSEGNSAGGDLNRSFKAFLAFLVGVFFLVLVVIGLFW